MTEGETMKAKKLAKWVESCRPRRVSIKHAPPWALRVIQEARAAIESGVTVTARDVRAEMMRTDRGRKPWAPSLATVTRMLQGIHEQA